MTFIRILGVAVLTTSFAILAGCPDGDQGDTAAGACTGTGSSTIVVSQGVCPSPCPAATAGADLQAKGFAKADADALCVVGNKSCVGTSSSDATTCTTIETTGGVTECHTVANASHSGTCQ